MKYNLVPARPPVRTKKQLAWLLQCTPRTLERDIDRGYLVVDKDGPHQQSPVQIVHEQIEEYLCRRVKNLVASTEALALELGWDLDRWIDELDDIARRYRGPQFRIWVGWGDPDESRFVHVDSLRSPRNWNWFFDPEELFEDIEWAEPLLREFRDYEDRNRDDFRRWIDDGCPRRGP